LRASSPLSSLTVDGVRYVAGINQFDEVVLFREDAGVWSVRRIGNTEVGTDAQLVLVADPEGSEPVLVLASDGALVVHQSDAAPGDPGEAIGGFDGRTAIVRGMTSFTNVEGVVHLAGFDAEGDLVIYYRDTSDSIDSAAGWNFDNLSEAHLALQGLPTPGIVSDLAAFATPWSGMNIVGLDGDGHVQSVWWSPESVLWKATDLSASVDGVPLPFVGEITAFVSPWGTIHINGTPDGLGHLTALWWAPGFGGRWQGATLFIFGPGMEGDSLTSYVTPWGGLNVVGRSMIQEVVVYWWSPESGEWQPETLPRFDMPLEATGRLSAFVETNGTVTQNIYARGTDGSLMHMSWSPGDGPWALENVTDELS
jgi:hypothetical protein